MPSVTFSYESTGVFNVYPLEADTTSTGIKVLMGELKAVFFVKDFWGDSGYRESMELTGKQQNGTPCGSGVFRW